MIIKFGVSASHVIVDFMTLRSYYKQNYKLQNWYICNNLFTNIIIL